MQILSREGEMLHRLRADASVRRGQWLEHPGMDKSGQIAVRITAPTTGTIIALDPDIPPNRQRLSLESTQPQSRTLRWQVNGKTTATGGRAQWPGRRVIRLVDAKGRVLGGMKLEVRGAGVVAGR